MKWLRPTIGSMVVLVATVLTVFQFGHLEARRLRKQVDALEQEKTQLIRYAERLSASRRVAQVNVIRQVSDEAGRIITGIRWQEVGADGGMGEPINLDIVGAQAYFEALVIKFEHRLVGEGDAERGRSLALFRRIFGEGQPPESAPELARSARPIIDDPELTQSRQKRLWDRFWDLVDDPKRAGEYGVRVAQCEAPGVRLRPGQIWELSLDAAGGLNLRKLSETDRLAGPQVRLP